MKLANPWTTTARLRRRLGHARMLALGWVRFGIERWLLVPVAPRLPRRLAYALAMTAALIDVPTGAGAMRRRELDATHAPRGVRRWLLGWRRSAAPYVDLVFLTRLVANLRSGEPMNDDTRVLISPEMRSHIESGRPLVIVFGHFSFAPLLAGLAETRRVQRTADAPMPVATAHLAPGARGPARMRNDLRDGLLNAVLDVLTGESTDVAEAVVERRRGLGGARALRRAVSTPGAVCVLAADPPWDLPGAYRRPFAGWARYPLSTGPARLARSGGAAIMPAIVDPRRGGGWTIRSGPLLEPNDFETAEALTDALVDILERRIGEHPTGYLLPLGQGRRWDTERHAWVPHGTLIEDTETQRLWGEFGVGALD